MKRLFCSINIGTSFHLKEFICSISQHTEAEGIKWVSQNNLHITMKFFGETPSNLEPAISDALRTAASAFSPFTFKIGGCGIFERNRQPAVLWMGIHPVNQIVELNHLINYHLGLIGFAAEKRAFIPHLTIGRIKGNLSDSFRSNIASYSVQKISDHFETKAIYLMQSILNPCGAEYKVLEEFCLGIEHKA